MSDKVTVKALKFHTHHGAAHEAGDVYEVAATEVDNLVAQGMAAYHDPPPPAPRTPSQPVSPITTADFRGKAKK
jgi:hypothetical protein